MKTELITTDTPTVYATYNAYSGVLTIRDLADMALLTKSETIELRDFLNQLDLTD